MTVPFRNNGESDGWARKSEKWPTDLSKQTRRSSARRWLRNNGTVGKKARSELFELRRLAVGSPARFLREPRVIIEKPCKMITRVIVVSYFW